MPLTRFVPIAIIVMHNLKVYGLVHQLVLARHNMEPLGSNRSRLTQKNDPFFDREQRLVMYFVS